MGDRTKIELADRTFGPPGRLHAMNRTCEHCNTEIWTTHSDHPEPQQDERRHIFPSPCNQFDNQVFYGDTISRQTGRDATPMHPSRICIIKAKSAAAGVPFVFKQHRESIGKPDLVPLAITNAMDDVTTPIAHRNT